MKLIELIEDYLYHSTNAPIESLRKFGLFAEATEDDYEFGPLLGKGIHYLLFFTDRPQTDYGDLILRFHRNAVSTPDEYSPDRGSFFYSRKRFAISPSSLEYLNHGKWIPILNIDKKN